MADLKINEIIKKIMGDYNLEFKETQEQVFINHVETFYERLQNHQDVGIELTDDLRNQISQDIWNQARGFATDFLEAMKKKTNNEVYQVPEVELFLIATHLLLL